MSVGPQPRASPSIPGDHSHPGLRCPRESLDLDPFASNMLEGSHSLSFPSSQPDVTNDPSLVQDDRVSSRLDHCDMPISPASFAQNLSKPQCSSENQFGDLSGPRSPGLDEAWLNINVLNLSMEPDPLEQNGFGNEDSLGPTGLAVEREQDQIHHGNNQSPQTVQLSQLISPQLTGTPSPAAEHSQRPTMGFTNVPVSCFEQQPEPSSTIYPIVPPIDPHHQHINFGPDNANLTAHTLDHTHRAPSPILKVSMHGGGDSPARSTSRTARRSSNEHGTNHSYDLLAPDDYCAQAQTEQSSSRVALSGDGSGFPSSGRGQGGVDPTKRGTEYTLSINEVEEKRQIDNKKAHVASWRMQIGADSGIEDQATVTGALHRGRRPPTTYAPSTRPQVDAYELERVHDARMADPETATGEIFEATRNDKPMSPSLPAEIEVPPDQQGRYLSPSEETVPGRAEPSAAQFLGARHSQNPLSGSEGTEQPKTANEAMYKYEKLTAKFDTASRIATWGSSGSRRRLSDSDFQSISGQSISGILRGTVSLVEERKDEIVNRAKGLMRSKSNSISRPQGVEQTVDISSTWQKVKKRSKSPSLKTDDALIAMGGPLAAIGSTEATTLDNGKMPTGPPDIWGRIRSKSVSRSTGRAGLAASRAGGRSQTGPISTSLIGDRWRTMEPSYFMDDQQVVSQEREMTSEQRIQRAVNVNGENLGPGLQGFRAHAQRLNPLLDPLLTERIVQAQYQRYQRLVELKFEHTHAVKLGHCSSEGFCFELGGVEKGIPVRASAKRPDATTGQFQVSVASDQDQDLDETAEGAVSADFPLGIPPPPVKHLPAEFECPLCFEVRKFQKPSDWTKHVHEDVQPFTCTFPDCTETMSFKRKADWVRHENEKHRHLEWWRCQVPECPHECYRKDNFVQHLVREHKKRDPKAKSHRRSGDVDSIVAGQAQVEEEVNEVWEMVDRCHFETQKTPKDELCKFCGNYCNTWKELTVHLAKHMELIAMPILDLVQRCTVIHPVTQSPSTYSQGSHQSPIFSRTPSSGQDGPPAGQSLNMPHFALMQNLPSNMSCGPYQAVDQASSSMPISPREGVSNTYPLASSAVRQSPQTTLQHGPRTHPGLIPHASPYESQAQQEQIYSSPVEVTPSGEKFDPSTTNHLSPIYAEGLSTETTVPKNIFLGDGTQFQIPSLSPNASVGQKYWYPPTT